MTMFPNQPAVRVRESFIVAFTSFHLSQWLLVWQLVMCEYVTLDDVLHCHRLYVYGEKEGEVQQTSMEKVTITKSAGPLSSDGYAAATATLLFST